MSLIHQDVSESDYLEHHVFVLFFFFKAEKFSRLCVTRGFSGGGVMVDSGLHLNHLSLPKLCQEPW